MNNNLMLQTTKHLTPQDLWLNPEKPLGDKVGYVLFENFVHSLLFEYEHKDEEGYHFNLTNLNDSIQQSNPWLRNYVGINTVPFLLAYLTKRGIPYTLDSKNL